MPVLPEVEPEEPEDAVVGVDFAGLEVDAGAVPLPTSARGEEVGVDVGEGPAEAADADALACGDPGAQPLFAHTSDQFTSLYSEGSLKSWRLWRISARSRLCLCWCRCAGWARAQSRLKAARTKAWYETCMMRCYAYIVIW